MRRSAAPSQAGKPKFVAPFRKPPEAQSLVTDFQEKEKQSVTLTDKSNVLQRILSKNSNLVMSDTVNKDTTLTEHDIKMTQNATLTSTPITQTENENISQPAKRPRFQAPTSANHKKVPMPSPNGLTCTQNSYQSSQNTGPSEGHDSSAAQPRYFNVVWCKRSNKKHKKWEGDAVLMTRGRSVILYDTDGKEIGKSSGYKSTELASLKEDETLPIGGKEIQVMSLMDEELFRSGKCFTGATAAPTSAPIRTVPDRENGVSKPFSRPQKSGPSVCTNGLKPEPSVITPRYDPMLPGALVMPRPSESHQWQWNKKCVPVIDVVVDPYLACHLRPHQREGVTFLYECVMGYRNFSGQGAILADDMGLGKTLQCISLIWTLLKQGPYGGKAVAKRILIVTPGSLVKNWFQEFKKWLGSERINVYAVSADKKVEDFMKTSIYPVLIISYEMIVRMYNTVSQLTFDLIVCDEGHRLKNTNIKTTSLIMSLPTRRRVVLTGTPIQNDLQEFFSIVEFCNPGLLGEIVLFCQPSELQLRLYQQLLKCQLIRSCLSGSLSGSPHLICIAALKQLCNHPSLVHNKSLELEDRRHCEDFNEINSVYEGLFPLFPDDYRPDENLEKHSGKLTVLSCLLHELHTSDLHEKIVVVSNHTKTLDLIQCLCQQKTYQFLRLDGQTPTSKRHELVQKFNSKHSNEFIFLLSSKAGGVGLNLVGASRLILYDIDWNPANDLQAMARVWRDGQRNVVHIYRLLTTGSIEEKVFQRQISKQGLSGAIMDTRDTSDVQFSKEDLRKKKRNLGMDELMSWKHYNASVLDSHPSWYLQEAKDKITFAFYSEVKENS